jgi:hypothetical protein
MIFATTGLVPAIPMERHCLTKRNGLIKPGQVEKMTE